MIGGIILDRAVRPRLPQGSTGGFFSVVRPCHVVRDASIKLGMLFFYVHQRLEIRLSNLRRLRQSLTIGLIGTLLPIGLGVGLAYLAPRDRGDHRYIFRLRPVHWYDFANPPTGDRTVLMDLGC